MLVEINPVHPEPRKIAQAVEALRRGGVIGYPTDAVYGLGCDIFNKKALDRLYKIKGMNKSQKLSFVCRDLAEVAKYGVMHDWVYRIMRRLLPGPYVFILEATREVPKVVQWNRRQVGIKVVDHPVVTALLEELGNPIVSSTAARSGQDPSPDPDEIDDIFPGLDLILDAGPGGTVPTSVLDLTGPDPKIVREGAGDLSMFE